MTYAFRAAMTVGVAALALLVAAQLHRSAPVRDHLRRAHPLRRPQRIRDRLRNRRS